MEVFRNFGSFFANLPKPHSRSSDKHFAEIFFGKILFSWFLVPTFSDVQQNFYRKVVETTTIFYLFRKPVDETDFVDFSYVFARYSKFGRRFFCFLAVKLLVKLSKMLSTRSGSTI